MNLWIIAGLGNPGKEYDNTRHNIGFMTVDALAADLGAAGGWKNEPRFEALVARTKIGPKECLLLKPQTYMNLSGQSIGAVARFYNIPAEQIIVAHDEYQIPVGEMKVSVGGGDSGHKGVASTIAHIGNTFTRYRLGIGNERPLENGLKGFVLNKFEVPEMEVLGKKMPEFASGIRLIVDRGVIIAMNHLNKRIKYNDRNATA